MKTISITGRSIREEIRKYDKRPDLVISEYIWNSFDANANNVWIELVSDNKNAKEFGYPTLIIRDDGEGWDMSDKRKVELFLDSDKKEIKVPYRSLPHGNRGVGRFSFCAIANIAEWQSIFSGKKYVLRLSSENIHKFNPPTEEETSLQPGTTLRLFIKNEQVTYDYIENKLSQELLRQFSWFLMLYPQKAIYINDKEINVDDFILDKKEAEILVDAQKIELTMVQWKDSLANQENSKVYYLAGGKEEFKLASGLNNQSDIFRHSAYANCEKFKGYRPDEKEVDGQQTLLDTADKRFISSTKKEIKATLEKFRNPYIEQLSGNIIEELKKEKIMPSGEMLKIPEEDFNELVRQTFVIAPQMFVKTASESKKMILNLLAALMGTSENNLILQIMDEVYRLDDEQKAKMSDLLKRTTLGNIIDTVSVVDNRLQTLNDLESIVYDPKKFKNTLEVKHLQAILDKEFWVFGEQFNLVSSTEGSIRKILDQYAKKILKIEDYEVASKSRRELDLFLTKNITIPGPNDISSVENIVVELKRPSIKLSKKEVDQIRDYRNQLLKEPACKAENMSWTFILVGSDFANDGEVRRMIESQQSNGEKNLGLIETVPSERTKIYVRKWSDIINCQLRPRFEYLRKELKITPKDPTPETPDQIAARHQ